MGLGSSTAKKDVGHRIIMNWQYDAVSKVNETWGCIKIRLMQDTGADHTTLLNAGCASDGLISPVLDTAF